MNNSMKLTMTAACAAMCVIVAFGAEQNAPQPPYEATPVGKLESRTKDKTRSPGIFGDYWWANRFLDRHQQVEKLRGKTVDIVLLGDSIMHFWEWKHPESWRKLTKGRTVLNLGYGGDRTENVIWRIQHGELDGYKAKNIVLMIGTNNNSSDSTNPTNVAKGVGDSDADQGKAARSAADTASDISPRQRPAAHEAPREGACEERRHERTAQGVRVQTPRDQVDRLQ